MVSQIDSKHVAVSGPNKSLDILSTLDLSVVANLDTDGQIPFVAARTGNLLFAGCNQGYLFNWNITDGFVNRNLVVVSHKISQMSIF